MLARSWVTPAVRERSGEGSGYDSPPLQSRLRGLEEECEAPSVLVMRANRETEAFNETEIRPKTGMMIV